MLIKTVVDETYSDAKLYESYCKKDGTEDFESIQLNLAETEYDDAFVEALHNKIAEYNIHTIFTYDYESSSDAGDGRDDYYTEENDEQLAIDSCIIKDGHLFGVLCEAFDCQCFLTLDHTEAIIFHPKNYGGTNYHFYRSKKFKLVSKNTI